MYRIESMYDATVEGLMTAAAEQRAERWMAACAFWLGRQQIYGEQAYWLALGAKITSLLPDADLDAISAQLSKPEDALLDAVGDWPEIPAGLTAVMASWSPAPAEVDLDALRTEAVRRIDRSAETYRLQFITPGDGQQMAYQQKLVEARAKVANPSIADSDVPHIVAEAAADEMTMADKAQQIVDTFAAWQHLSAAIEGKRMAAKRAVEVAETPEAIKAAANVTWEAA